MGMDVYGQFPTTKEGEYFRNNCWWWRPLAHYMCEIAPETTAGCTYWQSNDGDGLGPSDSMQLAGQLQAEIDSGRCAAYAERYTAQLDATPDERCKWCRGSGVRRDGVGIENGMVTKRVPVDAGHHRSGATGWCNACNGKGTVRPDETSYPFSVENVQEFVIFLRGCGGFEIW